jgi:hypothetical protein
MFVEFATSPIDFNEVGYLLMHPRSLTSGNRSHLQIMDIDKLSLLRLRVLSVEISYNVSILIFVKFGNAVSVLCHFIHASICESTMIRC